jgi:hypothetical protein
LARTLPDENKHKTVAGAGCFLSKQSHRETPATCMHVPWTEPQYEVPAYKCQLVATIFICPTSETIHVSHKHIRKLFYIPVMQYTFSRCALFYFLYLTDFHCTESMHGMWTILWQHCSSTARGRNEE